MPRVLVLFTFVVACSDPAPSAPVAAPSITSPASVPVPTPVSAPTLPPAAAETCDETALARRGAFEAFLIATEASPPVRAPGYPDARRLATALADDVPEDVRTQALARFTAVSQNDLARPVAFLGAQLAFGHQHLRCVTTEALRQSPRPAIEGVFDDLSHPQWLKPGASFFVGDYHGVPVTMFWDGEQPTFLPRLTGA